MKIKEICLIIITIAILASASGLIYYYAFFLPHYYQAKLDFQEEQKRELDACLREAFEYITETYKE